MKKIVVPGELVTEERKRAGSHVYMQEGKIYSDVLGLVNESASEASVVPLEGCYMPLEGDVIIGVIVAEKFSGYNANINSFYPAFISKKELRDPLRNGNVLSAQVMKVNELNEVDLSRPRVFFGGEIISVSPVKVPRIIGKNGSMLEVLKNGTGCNLMVGRNGRIWVKGGNIPLLVQAIDKIEREAHLDNLTNRMAAFLEQAKAQTAGAQTEEKAAVKEK
ncbi:MAG: exosome complex protein Rrp4 [Candidatus Diapherotrites archaeon]